jgi:hypothetical protein
MSTHFRLKVHGEEDWLIVYVRPPAWVLPLLWPLLKCLPYYRRNYR